MEKIKFLMGASIGGTKLSWATPYLVTLGGCKHLKQFPPTFFEDLEFYISLEKSYSNKT